MSAPADTASVLTELVDHTLVITINRPAARNAVDHAVSRGIAAAMDRAASDDAVRVVVLTGAGDLAFSAGADLKALARGEPARPPELDHLGFAGYARYPLDKPTIAAVNGAALGGGTELCLASDLVVAADSATFGLPEVTHGIVAGGGGALRLPAQIPFKRALELLFTADRIDAGTAYDLGLVNAVVPAGELRAASLALAGRIAANAPLAVQASKRMAYRALAGNGAPDWAVNAAEMAAVMATADAAEGPRAFAARRPPVWSGR